VTLPSAAADSAIHSHAGVTAQVSDLVLRRPVQPGWLAGLGLAALFTGVLGVAVTWLFIAGIGIWGVRIPVAWGFAIVNFVWWIGIGHAGTLISAILLLLHQHWRRAINRSAEAMTLFAVACAGMFPLLHLGRPQLFYWLLPYPNTMGLWPQFRSPLVWDCFAVATYFTVSLLFWYVGLVPDLATLRDRAQRPWVQRVYGVLALGWRGSARHWESYRTAYLLLAGLATPLVVSVHSIVGLDFAVALVPGWHSTLFPPYFVCGAIYSGFACVLLLLLPLRHTCHLQGLITTRHLDLMAKVMLATGLMVAYGYAMDWFMGWYSGEPAEVDVLRGYLHGTYDWVYWCLIAANVVLPQALWFDWVRTRPVPLFLASLSVLLGMWGERFVIVILSLQRPHLPSAWGDFVPTFWDWATLAGSIGLFLLLWFLFIRLLPALSMHELREQVAEGGDRPAVEPRAAPDVARVAGEPWGVLARFAGEREVVAAAQQLRQQGFERLDAYTPLPVDELGKAVGPGRNSVAKVTLIAALAGGAIGFGMQAFACAWDYPIDVGGKPHFSWPSFVPITFELAVLGGAFGAVIAMLVQNRLPQPYHPVFHARAFQRASADGFFIGVRADDRQFDRERTPVLLLALGALEVDEVPP
jgi:molybdopterin-containing oxidoreductase family membrane subunit